MARNLVQEKREEERAKALEVADAKEAEAKKPEATTAKAPEEKLVYITTEQVTLNNLNVIMAQLDILSKIVMEGFKQVGVKFEEAKEK